MEVPLEKKIEEFKMEVMQHISDTTVEIRNERKTKVLPSKKVLSDDYFEIRKSATFNERVIYMNGCWHAHDNMKEVAFLIFHKKFLI